MDTVRTPISFSVNFWPAAMIKLTSDPVAIRMMSGLPSGTSAKTYAPRRKPSAAANRLRSSVGTSCRVKISATGRFRVSTATRHATVVSFASHGRMTINRGIARNDANDFILKAVVVAATKVPRVNASFAGDAVIEYGDIHLSAPAATAAGSPLSGEKAVKFSDWKRRRARSDALLSCEGRLFP